MNTPTLEIYGTGTCNRGAELMAIAIATHLRTLDIQFRITVPMSFGNFKARARHGFYLTSEFPGKRQVLLRMYSWISRGLMREMLGWIPNSQIGAVLDASGFAYSDHWGTESATRLVERMNRRSRLGQTLVLMPQALGPFETDESIHSFKRIVDRASLLYARDKQSFDAATEIAGAGKIRLSPDFTIPLRGTVPAQWRMSKPFGAVVPNYRMIDQNPGESAQEYVEALLRVVHTIKAASLDPVVILHEAGEDRLLADEVCERAGGVQVVTSLDPLELKGILGRATVVVGSRYHALVSALSQAVPCVALGWSHKYRWLFEDFACGDLFVEDWAVANNLEAKLEQLLGRDCREEVAGKLRKRAKTLSDKVDMMWAEIDGVVGTREVCQSPR